MAWERALYSTTCSIGRRGLMPRVFSSIWAHRHAVDEQDDVVAVVAVVGFDAKLANDLKGVLAPVGDVDQGVIQWRAVVAGEGVAVAERMGGGKDVGSDNLIQQAGKLGVGELDVVEGLEFSRKFLSKVARSRMSGRSSYFRSRSLAIRSSSSWRSGEIIVPLFDDGPPARGRDLVGFPPIELIFYSEWAFITSTTPRFDDVMITEPGRAGTALGREPGRAGHGYQGIHPSGTSF